MSDIISKLLQGVTHFSQENCASNSSYIQSVEKGQSPKVMVIGCSDSLVDPSSLMGAEMGELFVHRNIAALIPPYQHNDRDNVHATSAALEHAVLYLEVDHIIVMGHFNCGGIAALLPECPKQNKKPSFISSWVQIASTAKDKILQEHQALPLSEKRHLCEKESILVSLKNLRTFPWIEERVISGKVRLHGWYFDRGTLSIYSEKQKVFAIFKE